MPVDGGPTFRGRRLFGDNKTLRGALFMTGGPTVAAGRPAPRAWYRRRLPREIAEADPLLVGALLGLGVFAGELPNSFLKRQLDIPPGGQRRDAAGVVVSLADQADFVVTSLAPPAARSGAGARRDAAELLAGGHRRPPADERRRIRHRRAEIAALSGNRRRRTHRPRHESHCVGNGSFTTVASDGASHRQITRLLEPRDVYTDPGVDGIWKQDGSWWSPLVRRPHLGAMALGGRDGRSSRSSSRSCADLPLRDADGILGQRMVHPASGRSPRSSRWRSSRAPWSKRRALGHRPGRRGHALVVRERWSRRRLRVVAIGLLSFYATYLSYRNLKSFLPFARRPEPRRRAAAASSAGCSAGRPDRARCRTCSAPARWPTC